VREIVELMGAFPGREFRMVHILRYVTDKKTLDERAKRASRQAALRALASLSRAGLVRVRPPKASRGGYASYRWATDQKNVDK
jgi:hypothetical protein